MEKIKECRFRTPFGSYTLQIFYEGKANLSYKFFKSTKDVIFEGNNFWPSAAHRAIDSDETVLSLMTFLTLQKGDTDKEYFDNYTPRQFQFRDSGEAEAVSIEVMARFCCYYCGGYKKDRTATCGSPGCKKLHRGNRYETVAET